MLALCACGLALMAGPTELKDYISSHPGGPWSVAGKKGSLIELKLQSQTWRQIPWNHDLVVVSPPNELSSSTVLLYVTGDRVDRSDLPFARQLAKDAGMRVAILFDVPNQPLFDLSEDALIAYTFGQFLQGGGDPEWPLLFPMTNAVIRALDALQKWDRRIERFVVAGASKRGWTTWLAAATGDKRIAGIAPMVFDFLNFPAQLRHQLDSWGKYSEMLADYVARDQPEAVETPEGKRLASLVDPFSYRDQLSVPKIIVLGSNDRYWTSDAHRLYTGSLKGRTFYRVVPNVGHDLGDGREASAAIGLFARGVARVLPSSAQSWFDKGKPPTISSQTWAAYGASRDFRDSKWIRNGTRPSEAAWRASFREWSYRVGDLTASFTSPITVEKASSSDR